MEYTDKRETRKTLNGFVIRAPWRYDDKIGSTAPSGLLQWGIVI